MCVRYRTKELEASGKQVGLKKTIFLFRTRRTHFRRGKKKKEKTKTETVIIITTTNTC